MVGDAASQFLLGLAQEDPGPGQFDPGTFRVGVEQAFRQLKLEVRHGQGVPEQVVDVAGHPFSLLQGGAPPVLFGDDDPALDRLHGEQAENGDERGDEHVDAVAGIRFVHQSQNQETGTDQHDNGGQAYRGPQAVAGEGDQEGQQADRVKANGPAEHTHHRQHETAPQQLPAPASRVELAPQVSETREVDGNEEDQREQAHEAADPVLQRQQGVHRENEAHQPDGGDQDPDAGALDRLQQPVPETFHWRFLERLWPSTANPEKTSSQAR